VKLNKGNYFSIQNKDEIIVKLEGQNDPLFQLTTDKSTK